MFFRNTKKPIIEYTILTFPTLLPNGIIVEYKENHYLINKNKSLRFFSPRARDSWHLIVVQPAVASIPEPGGVVGFRNGTLIENAKDGRIYLVSEAKRRLLTRPLLDYGFDWSDVVTVSDAETNFHTEGDEL